MTVPIEGQAEDDLGLRRVDLYRGVLGYRSRGLTMEVEPGTRTPAWYRAGWTWPNWGWSRAR